MTSTAAARWADALAAWKIPDEILDAAPDKTQWFFSPSAFAPERAAVEGPDAERPLRRIVTAWWDGTAGASGAS